jgi:dTDP-4-dehydrorhamnose reductase
MKKILLLGGNGRVGMEIRRRLEEEFEVISPASRELDITDFESVEKFVLEKRPEVVINCVMSHISVDDAELEENREIVFKVNAEASGKLAEFSEKISAQYFYFSTAYVFDGTLEGRAYLEDDIKNPLSVYAKSKAEGEELSLKNCSRTTVVRIEMPYTDSLEGKGNIVKTFYQMLVDGKGIKALDDQFCTPTLISDIGLGVEKLVKSEKYGIWHIAGNRTTPFEIASLLAEKLGLNQDLIERAKFADSKRPAKRPQNSCLDTSKIRDEFGLRFQTIDEGITGFVEKLTHG